MDPLPEPSTLEEMQMSDETLKRLNDQVTILAAASTAIDVTGSAVKIQRPNVAITFIAVVSAAASAADDLLDIYVDTGFYGASTTAYTWIPVVRFTRCTGTGGAKTYITKLCDSYPVASEIEIADALLQGECRNIVGDAWRARLDITNGAGTHTFTAGVYAIVS